MNKLPVRLIHCYDFPQLQNTVDYNAQILATLKEYVALRKTLAAIPEPPAEPPSETMDVDSVPAYTNGAAGSQEHSRQDASPAVPNSTRSTRELLTSVAQLADETVRSSREKLNIARFTCGLVRVPEVLGIRALIFHYCAQIDRYMRDLDRAIKEQEASISIGMREGTHPAKIVLPEVVPPGPRAPKPYHTSVVEELEDEELLDEPIEPPPESPAPEPEPEEVPAVPEPPPPAPPPPPPIRKTRSKSKSKKTHKSKSRTPHEQQLVFSEPPRDVNPDEGIPEKSTAPHRPTIRLTFSLPPAPSALPPPPVEEPVQPLQEMDPNENSDDKLYCICNGPSDGMVRLYVLGNVRRVSDECGADAGVRQHSLRARMGE